MQHDIENIEKRASRAMKRVNALGFTKGGKPMSIDQAREVIAAEEGHRNWHVLRALHEGDKQSSSKTQEPDHKGLASVDKLIKEYGQDGMNGVGLRGALQAMRRHWLDHFAEGHTPQIIVDDLESLIDHIRDARVKLHHWILDEAMRASSEQTQSEDDYVLVEEKTRPDRPGGNARSIYMRGGAFYVPVRVEGSASFYRIRMNHPGLNVANRGYFVRVEGLDEWVAIDAGAFKFLALSHLKMPFDLVSEDEFEALQVEKRYGSEHPFYDREDWSWQAKNGDTRLGYWQWVAVEMRARLDEDSEESSLDELNAYAPFVTGTWMHLFGPGSAETKLRFVADIERRKIVALEAENEILRWVACSKDEIEDVAESLFGANEAVLLKPNENGLERCISLPDWALFSA